MKKTPKKSTRCRATCKNCQRLEELMDGLRDVARREGRRADRAESERDEMAKLIERVAANDTARAQKFMGLLASVQVVVDAARVLPGLYVTAADGRPSFTSQAAADFVNALNQCASFRDGISAAVNAKPGVTVVEQTAEV